MVRVASVLCRVPVIKFRKGGLGLGGSPSAAAGAPAAGASPSGGSAAASQQPAAAAMSTSPVPDIDLPLRYRRLPLSDEEIDHINGGGISGPTDSQDPRAKQGGQAGTLSVIRVPNSILIDCKQKKKQAVSLNIVVQNVNSECKKAKKQN